MIVPLYCVRDLKDKFLNPMVDSNDDTAKRNFAYMINNGDVPGFSPQDFQLYKVGSFNTLTGQLDPIEVIELVADGVQVFGARYEK